MRADYVLLDLTPGAVKQGQPAEVLRMRGVGVLRMDLTVPSSGSAGPTKGEIRFEKPLVPAPPGMAAMVEFPIHYSVVCGDLVPDCSARTRDTTFALEMPEGATTSFTPCLQFRRGMSDKDVLVVIGPDCQDPRMKGTRIVKE
ncbi:MAG: hypothetical protein KJ062_03455 [Thermoanaerobaculia bacterium]|nr:hypothetical protein [Thermoanaerobaculia bacterium]